MAEINVAIKGSVSEYQQSIRLTVMSGGPDYMEAIIKCHADGAQLSVFNPFRHEWAVVNLKGLGDTRKPLSK